MVNRKTKNAAAPPSFGIHMFLHKAMWPFVMFV